ncbi:hypothetical protein ELQ32_19275 [Limnobaculum zhutongyuii]|nr:hypothetical protein ELQ32_19275 [Limnobaculum zhutongyuii]
MPFALCPLPFALCPLPFALCPLPDAGTTVEINTILKAAKLTPDQTFKQQNCTVTGSAEGRSPQRPFARRRHHCRNKHNIQSGEIYTKPSQTNLNT